MVSAPPPSGPPAGWYPDPESDSGYRWWDGSTWQSQTRSSAELISAQMPVPELIRGAMQGAVSRAGNSLAMVVVLILPPIMASSLGLYYGLRDTTVAFQTAETAAASGSAGPDISYGGTPWALGLGLIMLVVARVLGTVLTTSVARQTLAAQNKSPESWSESVRAALVRSRHLGAAALVRSMLTWSPFVVLGAAVVVSSLFVLLLPLALLLVAFLWSRLAFVDVVAGISPENCRPVAASWSVTGRGAGGVFVRLLAVLGLFVASIIVASMIGSLVVEIAGVSGEPLAPGATVIDFNQSWGPTAAGYLLSNVFLGLGLGAGSALSAAGRTLLYQDRGGAVAPSLLGE